MTRLRATSSDLKQSATASPNSSRPSSPPLSSSSPPGLQTNQSGERHDHKQQDKSGDNEKHHHHHHHHHHHKDHKDHTQHSKHNHSSSEHSDRKAMSAPGSTFSFFLAYGVLGLLATCLFLSLTALDTVLLGQPISLFGSRMSSSSFPSGYTSSFSAPSSRSSPSAFSSRSNIPKSFGAPLTLPSEPHLRHRFETYYYSQADPAQLTEYHADTCAGYYCAETGTCVDQPRNCPCLYDSDTKCLTDQWYVCYRGPRACSSKG